MKKHLFTLLLVITTTLYAQTPTPEFYHGVDLSYVNEMEDCGAVYRVAGEIVDPYQVFAQAGANLVRVRLWHSPARPYSTLADVIRSLTRAKAHGMETLLDIHYSDTWADPAHQTIPAEWAALTDAQLQQAVYAYTYDVLMTLHAQGVWPDWVQLGNEINTEMLRPANTNGYPVRWPRQVGLLNQALAAVQQARTDSGHTIRTVIHIAQPENAAWWFSQAQQAGLANFDAIGLSYYAGWSSMTISQVGAGLVHLHEQFQRPVMIVETAYPWTLESADSAVNLLGQANLLSGYPATPSGQARFLAHLMNTVQAAGGIGVVYWEPAWVSTPCYTEWGQGSHWENATLFDFDGQALQLSVNR